MPKVLEKSDKKAVFEGILRLEEYCGKFVVVEWAVLDDTPVLNLVENFAGKKVRITIEVTEEV